MPGPSLLTLLDDISSVLDDVATLTKVAVQKTAGVLGDDLALNAEQVAGVRVERELPVVWAVARGSLVNKAILVPAALGLSVFLPQVVTPLLMIGGAYLCFEGFEKLAHAIHLHAHATSEHTAPGHATSHDNAPFVAGERSTALARVPQRQTENDNSTHAREAEKIKGAIRTDFVLSAEIVTIALGSVSSASFATRAITLVLVGLVMTVGVYGFVALIVKMDDAGLYLHRRAQARTLRWFGRGLVRFAPWLMKALSVAGTIAMFLVGGSIVAHGLPWTHAMDTQTAVQPSRFEAIAHSATTVGMNAFVGLVVGLALWALVFAKVRIASVLRGGAK
jgi:predicted DNA repair protein MutK